jgi:RNA polymerase sigma-70 factor (ECF subfamily)
MENAQLHITDPIANPVPEQDMRDLLRARGGDQQAYKAIYERHMASLFRFLTQFTDDRDLIADWVQLAFIKAFQNLDRFEGRSSFKSWLYKISINEMRQTFRSSHREPDYVDEEQLYSYSDQRSSPADWITLKDKIRRLPDRQRLVFLMFEIEGFSHAEIAKVLSITESSSRSILTRVKIQLRQSLTDL